MSIDKKMKIVNVILTSQNGGAEQVFIDYCNILKNRLNHEVIAVLKEDAPYKDEVNKLGVKIFNIRNDFGFYDFIAIKKLKKILIENDADIVIGHNGRSATLIKKAAGKVKNKKITTIAVNHSDNVKRSIGADFIFSVNKKIFYKTIDLGQKSDKSFVISNAIDLKNYQFLPKEINFKKEEITIGIIGRFDPTKGFFEAIKAINIANLKDNKFKLKIAGSGKIDSELKILIKNLNMSSNVEFLGWIKNKEEFFKKIDMFILPSLEEPFGLVVIEAMKYGVPIISSNADGPKEILRDKIDALIVDIEPKETLEKRLSEKIIYLANNENLAKEMIENSYKRLQNNFSFDALESKFREIFGSQKK